MQFVLYTHSAISDWNHGNVHFLRGVMRDLKRRGHGVRSLEPQNSWSRQNLIAEQGPGVVAEFHRAFPCLHADIYDDRFDHAAVLDAADVVIVHEWTDPALVARLGQARQRGGRFTLLFHDTHHRAVSAGEQIAGMDLSGYDGVLAFGETLRQQYLRAGWGRNVFTWHEAADDALFRPLADTSKDADLVWIGNWGDGERTAELDEFLIEPAGQLSLDTTVHGVRYPTEAISKLARAGINYRDWIANADVPKAFARHRMAVHIPRAPYVHALPGIPTIRMFEALACGIPLVSAPWDDVEGLFRPGVDFLCARNGRQMRQHLSLLRHDPVARHEIAQAGLETIRARHTCRHRVDELLAILRDLGVTTRAAEPGAALRETA